MRFAWELPAEPFFMELLRRMFVGSVGTLAVTRGDISVLACMYGVSCYSRNVRW